MAGTRPTPDAVINPRIEHLAPLKMTAELLGPLSALVRVGPGVAVTGNTIKAVWRNEIGDAQ